MGVDQRAMHDFDRAASRAFWRRVVTRLTGENNELLPFDDVREKLIFRGQHYIGLKQVPITQIVGSMGRYNDFDREFLPTQTRTKGRWISIDKAHYYDINLPPVDLYKVGEIYFVKDGNHRVSVARERGQEYIDAYVTEIDIPVLLTTKTTVDDLDLKHEQSEFILETNLDKLRPDARVEASVIGVYPKLIEHIKTHQYYLGLKKDEEVALESAVISWYDNVYLPLVEIIRLNGLDRKLPGTTEAELYLWIMEYMGYLRQIAQISPEDQSVGETEAGKQLLGDFQAPVVRELVQTANRSTWIRDWIMQEDNASFMAQTYLHELRPDARIETTLMGQYETLKEHIVTHRWYLGEYRKKEVTYEDAVTSWYDYVYMPIVEMIREQKILDEFPGRTETDLYLWIIRHQWFLRENYGSDVSLEEAVEQFTDQFTVKGISKFFSDIRKLLGF
jgi:hypothetical protein